MWFQRLAYTCPTVSTEIKKSSELTKTFFSNSFCLKIPEEFPTAHLLSVCYLFLRIPRVVGNSPLIVGEKRNTGDCSDTVCFLGHQLGPNGDRKQRSPLF